jgi:DNA-binding response OmpR family regulator
MQKVWPFEELTESQLAATSGRDRNIIERVTFTIGPYTFRPDEKSLRKREKDAGLYLTKKEVVLLSALCRAGKRAVPWQILREEGWGKDAVVSKHALQTHIYRLRQALEADPRDPRLLETMPEGYRLNIVE